MMKTRIGQVIEEKHETIQGIALHTLVIKSGNHTYLARTNEYKQGDMVKFTWDYMPCSTQRQIKQFYK